MRQLRVKLRGHLWAMDAASDSEYGTALAPEREQGSTSSAAYASAVEQQIEQSKRHWSLVTPSSLSDCPSTDEDVAADNMAAFEELQRHPSWCHFFKTFGYDTEVCYSAGTMEVGEKFAEGGQAELFPVHITWADPKQYEIAVEEGAEWVLKVFKKGTLLRDLQKQWPHGYLHWWAQDLERLKRGEPPPDNFNSQVACGTLLRDGRFGFLMVKEEKDLRSLIDCNMLEVGHGCGPFPKEKAEEIMYRVARGMEWLHNRDIIHRDLKASNVLVRHVGPWLYSVVADFECSIRVVGTGFFRAPEILQACKDRVVSQREDLFTREADVYSYGMICYEVLTGKLPFENHPLIDDNALLTDLVISGLRPMVPEFVKDWVVNLVRRCWEHSPMARPSIREIMSILEAKSRSKYIKRVVEKRANSVVEV